MSDERCRHCGGKIFQPYSESPEWYHDDREGTARCQIPETGRWRKAKPQPKEQP